MQVAQQSQTYRINFKFQVKLNFKLTNPWQSKHMLNIFYIEGNKSSQIDLKTFWTFRFFLFYVLL